MRSDHGGRQGQTALDLVFILHSVFGFCILFSPKSRGSYVSESGKEVTGSALIPAVL